MQLNFTKKSNYNTSDQKQQTFKLQYDNNSSHSSILQARIEIVIYGLFLKWMQRWTSRQKTKEKKKHMYTHTCTHTHKRLQITPLHNFHCQLSLHTQVNRSNWHYKLCDTLVQTPSTTTTMTTTTATTSIWRCLSSQSLSYPTDHQQYQTTVRGLFTFINIFQSVQAICFSDLFPSPKLYKKNDNIFSNTFMARIVRFYTQHTQQQLWQKLTFWTSSYYIQAVYSCIKSKFYYMFLH